MSRIGGAQHGSLPYGFPLGRPFIAVPVIEGFGTSDRRCSTHLFHWTQVPSIAVFQRLTHIRFPTDAAVCLWNLSC